MALDYVVEHSISDFNDLQSFVWGSADYTLQKVAEAGKEQELMDFLESYFSEFEKVTDDMINDLLWHDSDFVLEELGISEDDDDEDDTEDTEDSED